MGLVIFLYIRTVFLYIRETPNIEETKELSKALRNFDCIIGDLNLNPKIPDQNKKLMTICNKTKVMALDEITTINGSQLDHVLIENTLQGRSYATSFFNLTSDHKSIVFRCGSTTNRFTSQFQQKNTFDSEQHIKKIKSKIQKTGTLKEFPEKMDIYQNELSTSSKILRFINPGRSNLCLSNSIVNALLNIESFRNILSENNDQMKMYQSKNPVINELSLINNLPNFEMASTNNLRFIVSSIYEDNGQNSRNFANGFQHDAAEFLNSIFEHIFKDSKDSNCIDEKIFGGLYQEKIVCGCGNVKESAVQRLSEILSIELKGCTLKTCLDEFLSNEEIQCKCEKCGSGSAMKKMDIVKEPSTLILQLKRYEYDITQQEVIKRQDEIVCPRSIEMPSGNIYRLSSIVNHIGNMPTEGHYNTLVFDNINHASILLDDQNIYFDQTLNPDINRLCYIVTYTKDE